MQDRLENIGVMAVTVDPRHKQRLFEAHGACYIVFLTHQRKFSCRAATSSVRCRAARMAAAQHIRSAGGGAAAASRLMSRAACTSCTPSMWSAFAAHPSFAGVLKRGHQCRVDSSALKHWLLSNALNHQINVFAEQHEMCITVLQVHNDLKTKNILLSDGFDIAKIGAHKDLPSAIMAARE